MDQDKLTEIFKDSQYARKKFGQSLSSGWGSAVHGDKDSLWDSNTDTHWERDNNPEGLWKKIPHLNG